MHGEGFNEGLSVGAAIVSIMQYVKAFSMLLQNVVVIHMQGFLRDVREKLKDLITFLVGKYNFILTQSFHSFIF